MSRSPLFTALAAVAVLAAAAPGASAATATTCDKVASTAGNDSAAGTLAAPYRTAQKLVNSLASGQVGCLRAGTYEENVAISHAGVTLTSYPGESASVVGRFWVKQGADGVTVSSLKLDAVNASLPSPTVNGDDALFVGNEVTSQRRQICFDIGNQNTWGRAHRTIIRGNRIHDCGAAGTNQIHGIYVVAADDTQIVDNVIYNNADRGVQLYPDAQRTTVRGNIIDGNGEGVIFSGDDGTASSGNVVEDNIISNSRIRTNVESWYPAGNPVGTGNVVRHNCLWKGATGSVDLSGGGFTASGNTTADPQFVNRAEGDFRLAAGSPCAAILGDSAAPAGLAGQAPVDGSPAPVTVVAPDPDPAPAPAPSADPAPVSDPAPVAAPAPATTPATSSTTSKAETTSSASSRMPITGTTWKPAQSTSAPTVPSRSTGMARTAAKRSSAHRVCKTTRVSGHRWVRRCSTVATTARARKAAAAHMAAVRRARARAAALHR